MESFLIAEEYVPNQELILVAKAVLLAQDIKEESWEVRSYTKNDSVSAKEAVEKLGCKTLWVEIIHGWNVHMWNDCQAWAQDVIAR